MAAWLVAGAVTPVEVFLPSECVHCGERALLFDELAPFEKLGAALVVTGMCARHWSNFAQGMAQSQGLTLLRREDEQQVVE